MSFWRRLTRGMRGLANRKAADHEVAEEVHFVDEGARPRLGKRDLVMALAASYLPARRAAASDPLAVLRD
jgi:hypothetical protein